MEKKHSFKDFDELFEKGSFVPLLRGDKEYEFVCRHANVPTDWSMVSSFLCQYYESNNYNPEIIEVLRNSIIKLAQESAVGSWCALEIIYFFSFKGQYKKRRFDVITDDIIEIVRTEVIKNKKELEQNTEWGGHRGLWKESLWTVKIIKKCCDIDIILE